MRIDPALRIDPMSPQTAQKDPAVQGAHPRRQAEAAPKQAEKPEMEWSKEELMAAVEQANQALKHNNRRFDVSVHEGTDIIMVRVFNSETDELIREIPPEKILNLIANLWEMAGIVVDERR